MPWCRSCLCDLAIWFCVLELSLPRYYSNKLSGQHLGRCKYWIWCWQWQWEGCCCQEKEWSFKGCARAARASMGFWCWGEGSDVQGRCVPCASDPITLNPFSATHLLQNPAICGKKKHIQVPSELLLFFTKALLWICTKAMRLHPVWKVTYRKGETKKGREFLCSSNKII